MFELFFQQPLSVFQKGTFVFQSGWPVWLLAVSVLAGVVLLAWFVWQKTRSAGWPILRSATLWVLQSTMVAVLLIMLGLFLTLGSLVAIVAPAMFDEFRDLRSNLPQYAEDFEVFMSDFGFDTVFGVALAAVGVQQGLRVGSVLLLQLSEVVVAAHRGGYGEERHRRNQDVRRVANSHDDLQTPGAISDGDASGLAGQRIVGGDLQVEVFERRLVGRGALWFGALAPRWLTTYNSRFLPVRCPSFPCETLRCCGRFGWLDVLSLLSPFRLFHCQLAGRNTMP